MDTFAKNYWGLYLDFLDDFGGLIYKGYRLAYLCHYQSLIRGNKVLMGSLGTKALTKKLKNKVQSPLEIQSRFNSFKAPYQKTWRRGKGGKIVLHDVYDLLRFPGESLSNHFDKKNTLIIWEKGMKVREESFPRAKGFNYQYFNEYSEAAEKAITLTKQKAKEMIQSFPAHHMYQNNIFQKRFLMQLAKIINRINESLNLFKRVNVSAIVVPSTHYPESRTLVVVAANNGIPTVCMQHGIISGEFGYLPKLADIDAVYGQFEFDWFKNRGAKDKGTEIIGHPRFDLLQNPPTVGRKKLMEQLGLDPNKKNVLLIVRGHAKYKEWDQFLKRITVKQQVNLILKDYPNHKIHPLTKSNPYVHSSKGCKLYDLIHMSEVVVTYYSTVALEAMLAGKTVFILDRPFGGYSGYFGKMGDLSQEDPGKLASIFSEYIKGGKMSKYADRKVEEFLSYAYNSKEKSGKRLIELLKRLF